MTQNVLITLTHGDKDTKVDLRLEDLKRLNGLIESKWSAWVDASPMDWRKDGFLAGHAPIAVTSRFGQDQPICKPNNREDEAETWLRERHYDKIRFVSFALATHVE